MKQFHPVGICQLGLQIGGVILTRLELHQMTIAIPGGKLDQAEAIPMRIKALGLGINGNDIAEINPGGQIVMMEMGSSRKGPFTVTYRSDIGLSLACGFDFAPHLKAF